MKVEVNDMSLSWVLCEADGLVGSGGGAKEPAWVGSRLKAPCPILERPEEGKAGRVLLAVVVQV